MRKVIGVLSLWLLADLLFICWAQMNLPLNQKGIFEVKPGWTVYQTIDELEKRGLLRCALCFKLMGRFQKVKAGDYQIYPSMTSLTLFNHLCQGQNLALVKVTVPEGATVRDIASILSQKELVDSQEFLKMALDPKISHSLGIQSPSLEGYLFPTTYFLEKDRPDETLYIIKAMTKEFKHHYHKYALKAKARGLSQRVVVTLASIVEKETAIRSEKPLVASVYLNRLKLNMPLQADPTILYVLKRHQVLPQDLRLNSTYNTYLHRGLPPTPICNPGEDSIKAVVEAPHTPFLYFCAMGNGHHYFSVNFRQHRQAIQRYLKRNYR